MLTIPMQLANLVESRTPEPAASVLVIGRSEKVLKETVDILRNDGRVAGATNDFHNVLAQFDIASLDVVVFGGMVPPRTKEALRAELAAANPAIAFVQGLAGIPGLIAEQVQAALAPSGEDGGSIEYDGGGRTVLISLQSPQPVRVIAFWGTAFVPPDPESTSEVTFDGTLDAGTHALPLPAHIPNAASFVVVHVGPGVHPFVVGPMPPGTTIAPAAGDPPV
jgi:hypothetical protein